MLPAASKVTANMFSYLFIGKLPMTPEMSLQYMTIEYQ